MSKETGGAAFPTYHDRDPFRGMTLRDYFAAKALEAFVHNRIPVDAAKEAYDYADAMLEARK